MEDDVQRFDQQFLVFGIDAQALFGNIAFNQSNLAQLLRCNFTNSIEDLRERHKALVIGLTLTAKGELVQVMQIKSATFVIATYLYCFVSFNCD